MDDEEKYRRMAKVGMSFSPGTPVDSRDLFAGRIIQIREVLNLIYQRGVHGVIYGERGVGKTSLVSVIYDFLAPEERLREVVRVNCDVGIQFAQLWRNIFRRLAEFNAKKTAGFQPIPRSETTSLEGSLPENPTPEDIRLSLESLPQPAVVIIDEFDRVGDRKTSSQMADTIKTLSDHGLRSTIILVGVADSVNQLIAEHRSIERSLVQIKMPRMSLTELLEILTKCSKKAEMQIDDQAKMKIARLSEGLPHYTHLLGQHSSNVALEKGETRVVTAHVKEAVKYAVSNAQQSIVDAYHKAVSSPRETLYPQVLLACAMAHTDELGYFAARDVREPMSRVMNKPYDVPAFSRHLNDFCEKKRGPVLQKHGETRRFRFRFVNPLMEPFVIMNGISKGIVSDEMLDGD
jgi:Cdc6-like AAA superfamily ATPase